MTTLTALIPRLRVRTGQVVAIRCIACRQWRKPRHFNRTGSNCNDCSHGAARRRLRLRATRRG